MRGRTRSELTADFLARHGLHATLVLRKRLMLSRDSDSSLVGCDGSLEAGTKGRKAILSIAMGN